MAISLPRFFFPTHPSTKDWETFKDLIVRLYIEEGKHLNEVQSYLLDAFNFQATPRMYKRRLTEWKVCKVLRLQDVCRLEQEILEYRAVHNVDPPGLMVNGRFLEIEKVKRSIRRHHQRERKGSNESTPTDSLFSDSVEDDLDDDEDGTPAVESQDLASLSNQELGVLSVAILQTDYHLEELQMRMSFNGCVQAFTSWASPTVATVASVGHLRELDSVLYQSRKYYSNVEHKRQGMSSAIFKCSTQEATEARDFYARYWLGLLLGAGDSIRNERLASSLYDGVFSQTGLVLKEDHPHFLPWICFVIAYPRRWKHGVQEARYIQEQTLKFAQWMTESIGGRDDPRFIIQQQLARSCHRREIALVLLRQILDTFCQTTQGHYICDLQSLAKLFEQINKVSQLNKEDIEGVLQQWARSSLSIAKLVQKDQLNKACEVSNAGLAV